MNPPDRTSRKWRVRVPANAVHLLLFCLGFWFIPNSPAQSSTNRPNISNRWLLIVDTSKEMKPRSEAAQNLAARLAASGVAGQMRSGDSLGLWTFNEELYSGRFPLQDWTPQTSQTVARRVFEFLKAQPFEKESRWDKVMPDLKAVVRASDFITVIFISDGTTKMQGTPFDEKINARYAEWQDQQKKAAMPFVTVLRAQSGNFTNFAVNTPPFPLEMPPLPEELLHPKVVVEPKIVETPKPTVVPPPLIISGRKPEPVQSPVEVPIQPPTNTVPAVSKPAEPATNAVAASHQPVVETPKEAPTVIQEPAANPVASPIAQPIEAHSSAQPTANMHNWMLIVAIAVAFVFLVILLLLVRRSRRAAHVSLITRSLDREQR